MPQYNTLVVLFGASLLGACAGLIGCFAVLRRQALMGDAVAHAALPGLCLAFMALGQRSLPAMLLGALMTGLLGVGLVSFLRRSTRIKEDAAIGIVLSVLFGAGMALSRMIQNTTSTGSKAGLDSYILGKTAGMIASDIYWIAGVACGCLLIVVAIYKEFKLAAFDAGFAHAQGWPAGALDLLLMALIAVTVVIGLPAVGVVLMTALLILPAVSARFWTDRLWKMLLLSALFGLAIGAAGTTISAQASGLPTGPIIVLCGTTLFLASMFFAPKRGAIARWRQRREFRKKLARQTMLRTLFDLAENQTGGPARGIPWESLRSARSWNAADCRRTLQSLAADKLLDLDEPHGYRLTPAGRAEAAKAVRGFRLWGLFLTEQADMAGSVVDMGADAVDRLLSPSLVKQLEAQLAAEGRLP